MRVNIRQQQAEIRELGNRLHAERRPVQIAIIHDPAVAPAQSPGKRPFVERQRLVFPVGDPVAIGIDRARDRLASVERDLGRAFALAHVPEIEILRVDEVRRIAPVRQFDKRGAEIAHEQQQHDRQQASRNPLWGTCRSTARWFATVSVP